MFQKDLGSLLDKSARVEALVPSLAAAAGLDGEQWHAWHKGRSRGCGCGYARNLLTPMLIDVIISAAGAVAVAAQAAHLCKADLATSMVSGPVGCTLMLTAMERGCRAKCSTALASQVQRSGVYTLLLGLSIQVTEMTALAGTMGRHYALKEGLPAGAENTAGQARCAVIPLGRPFG